MPTSTARIDPATFRDALGRFATGVTVITAQHEGAVHGMTANGFMSVSLEPLLVLVSIARTARMHGLLEGAAGFGVNVLSDQQQDLSVHFAGKPKQGVEIPFHFAAGVPLLEGVLVEIATRTVARHEAGDHTLFVGEVVHLDAHNGQPLIFHSGAYTKLHVPRVEVRREGDWAGFWIESQDTLVG